MSASSSKNGGRNTTKVDDGKWHLWNYVPGIFKSVSQRVVSWEINDLICNGQGVTEIEKRTKRLWDSCKARQLQGLVFASVFSCSSSSVLILVVSNCPCERQESHRFPPGWLIAMADSGKLKAITFSVFYKNLWITALHPLEVLRNLHGLIKCLKD